MTKCSAIIGFQFLRRVSRWQQQRVVQKYQMAGAKQIIKLSRLNTGTCLISKKRYLFHLSNSGEELGKVHLQ